MDCTEWSFAERGCEERGRAGRPAPIGAVQKGLRGKDCTDRSCAGSVARKGAANVGVFRVGAAVGGGRGHGLEMAGRTAGWRYLEERDCGGSVTGVLKSYGYGHECTKSNITHDCSKDA